jgi:hypothetical protein
VEGQLRQMLSYVEAQHEPPATDYDATPVGATPIKRERSYFGRNAQRMQYQTLRNLDLPIGSGAVESSAKYLVQQRMKRVGMRWFRPGRARHPRPPLPFAQRTLTRSALSITYKVRVGPAAWGVTGNGP